jgi:hypothetical protein
METEEDDRGSENASTKTNLRIVDATVFEKKCRLYKLSAIYDLFPPSHEKTTISTSVEKTEIEKRKLWENVFAFCCRWSSNPSSFEEPSIAWDSFFSLYLKDRRLFCHDSSKYERPIDFVIELKKRCQSRTAPIPSEEFDALCSNYEDRFSYASKKDHSSRRKTGYRYGTRVLERYESFGDFKNAVISEGRPKAEAELILDAFVTKMGGYDASDKNSMFYFLKIDETASAVVMTVKFAFNDVFYLSNDRRVSYNDRFLALRGTDAKIGSDCTFLMIDKALWLCVHSSWLAHMDSALPYYQLLKKHWFFRSYDPTLDKIRKQNVLYALLNWIDPGRASTKKSALTCEDVIFNNYYDSLFVIVNRFKTRTGSYEYLEECIKDSFLFSSDANVPSLVKSVRDMIALKKEHVLTLSIAKKILGLFDRNIVSEKKHPIAHSVLEEMVKRRKYVGSIEGVSGSEKVRVMTHNKFINYDFTLEFGCTKQKFFESVETDMIKCREINVALGICEDSNFYDTFNDEDYDDTTETDSETVQLLEDERWNLNDALKRNIATSSFVSRSRSSASSSYSFDATEETDESTDERSENDEKSVSNSEPIAKDKKKSMRRIECLNKKIATLALYFLCASPDLPSEYAKSLFLNLHTVTLASSRNSDRKSSKLLPKFRKQQVQNHRQRYGDDNEGELEKFYVHNNRKSKRSMVYEPDRFEIVPLGCGESVRKKREAKTENKKEENRNVVADVDDDVFDKKKENDEASSFDSKHHRVFLNPKSVLDNFLWTDPFLSSAYDVRENDSYIIMSEEFGDIVATTDIFLCLCERLSSSYFEKNESKKRHFIESSNYESASKETFFSNSNDDRPRSAKVDFSSSIGVVESEKRSKFSNSRVRAKKNETSSSFSFDFIIVDDRIVDKTKSKSLSGSFGKQYVSEESFVMIFRNKQRQQQRKNEKYDFICDTLFFESDHEKYGERCLFDHASELRSYSIRSSFCENTQLPRSFQNVPIFSSAAVTACSTSLATPSVRIKDYNATKRRKKRTSNSMATTTMMMTSRKRKRATAFENAQDAPSTTFTFHTFDITETTQNKRNKLK